ncbi:MAG: NAD(P)-binding protein [Acinetobacter pittii]|jgi:predicted NAD/FAD-binding protein|nr:NAD(P)-binding protein [Acinetobacter pittii]
MEANEPRKNVAVIGTGMAGLVVAYILRNDSRGRFEVEVFEKV